jgi:hypothetical protein
MPAASETAFDHARRGEGPTLAVIGTVIAAASVETGGGTTTESGTSTESGTE